MAVSKLRRAGGYRGDSAGAIRAPSGQGRRDLESERILEVAWQGEWFKGCTMYPSSEKVSQYDIDNVKMRAAELLPELIEDNVVIKWRWVRLDANGAETNRSFRNETKTIWFEVWR